MDHITDHWCTQSTSKCGLTESRHNITYYTTWGKVKGIGLGLTSVVFGLMFVFVSIVPESGYEDESKIWNIVCFAFGLASLYGAFTILRRPGLWYTESRTVQTSLEPQTADELKLQAVCSSVMHLFDMPEPRLRIRPQAHFHTYKEFYGLGHPELYPGSEDHKMRAHASGNDYICFNEASLSAQSPDVLIDIMKHELVHTWMHHHNLSDGYSDSFRLSHGPIFQAKAKEVGTS